MTESSEFYRKWRPETFRDVIGQDAVVKQLVAAGKAGKIPQVILFTGPSGVGKTTLTRILKKALKVGDPDYQEINGSDKRGIDDIRQLLARIGLSPLEGDCRLYAIDECHALTSDAQNALLKALEDTPPHVRFILATTDPQKLKKTIVTRCSQYQLKELTRVALKNIVQSVAERESLTFDPEVVQRIVEAADGSARKALVILNSVAQLTDTESQLEAIEAADSKTKAFDIFRALIDTRTKWSSIISMLSSIEEDPEGIRRLVLACCRNVVLSGKSRSPETVIAVMEAFRYNYYDTGKAGLLLSCWEALEMNDDKARE